MSIDIALLQQYSGALLDALLLTVEISVLSILGSLLPGLALAFMTRSKHTVVRWLGHAGTAVTRNVPSIIQLFVVFYLLPLAFDVSFPRMWSAVIAFAFNGAGYVAAIVRTGLEGVPRGQWEAARSLGIRGPRLYRRIVLPQAMVLVTGPLMNEVTRQVKSSSIASTIAIQELMYTSSDLSSETFDPFTFLTGVAVLYFAIIFPISLASRYVQVRLTGGLRSAAGPRTAKAA